MWNSHSNGSISISQPGYIEKVIKELNIESNANAHLPLPEKYLNNITSNNLKDNNIDYNAPNNTKNIEINTNLRDTKNDISRNLNNNNKNYNMELNTENIETNTKFQNKF